nr:VaFE repeat-containing surface-anchored protein [Corynebacterium tuberculostearicum]
MKNISREGWMVFTAVLAAIAVIAAMVAVPGGKAEAAEPTDFVPNETLSPHHVKDGRDTTWGPLVWAGVPEGQPKSKQTGNDVGWAWCIDFTTRDPADVNRSYHKSTAGALRFDDPKYQDAAIGVAMKLRDATKAGDKKLTANYSVYLAALVSDAAGRSEAIKVIRGDGVVDPDRFAAFTGSEDEFTSVTGLRIISDSGKNDDLDTWFEVDPSVTIESQPADAFITIVGPDGVWNIHKGRGQRVVPVDQPGLPDNGGGSEEPTTSEEKPSNVTTPENPGGETSPSGTTENPEPSGSEGTTPKDTTSETTPDKTTDVVPNPEPTPTTSEQEKDLEPKIETEASIKDGNRVEKGATVIDTVTYKDLVPGKKYTLKAKLISKEDGETVLGEGSEELVPEESAGEKDVEITVNDKADPAVDAAVAFEKLVSTEVDKDGNETTGSTDENVIATHENINDEKQTVNTKWTPSIETNADLDNAKQVKAGVTVKDTVTYTDLVPGKEYTLKAELRNKAENDKGEHEVVGKGDVTFTPEKSAGEQVVDIKVNDDVEGVIKAAVAFEDLYSKQVDENGKETPNSDEEKKITDHRDIDDEKQTVTSEMEPSIGTKAEKAEGDEIKAGTVITDKVKYNDLVAGKEYTLNAELRSKVKDDNGEYPVIGHGEKTFVPSASEGEVEVKITVDEGVTEAVDEAVAFEYLTSTAVNKDGEDSTTGEKNDIADHTNIEDKAQTVKSDKPSETTTPETTTSTPTGETDVPDTPGGGGEVETSTPSSSEDSSTSTTSETSESEEPGNSESEQPSESEEPSESESGEPSESESVETTSSEASETSESDKPSDGESTTPDKPTEPSESTEPNEPGTPGDDENDTPKVSTNADFEGGLREVVAGAKVVDQVSYEGLVPGKEYILDAQLISKEDGKTVLGETKGHKFTPESANGTEAVTITVNDDVTEPVEAAVAFETLTSTQVDKHGEDNPTDEDNPNPVGEHKDIDDEDQTVTSEGSEKTPKVSTNADFEGGLREVVAGAKVVDQVSYEGLVPGKEYILDAQLISKEDGKTVLGETKGHKFTPESANGTEAVTITVNDDVTEPVEAAVAFETLTSTQVDKHGEDNPTDEDNPNPVGEHKDIDDEDQTVTSEGSEKTPKVSTNADFEGGLREVVAGAKVVDQVSYEGLVPGKEYILDAQLISKEDGKTVLGETKGHKFTPESANGTEAVTITVNDDVTEPVEAAVAFETLTSTQVDKHGEDNPTDEDNPNPVGEHKDIDDEDQTVTSEGSEKTPKVSTNADFEGGLREVVAGAKVVDQVSYEGLVPGKEYILDAQLISKEDGKTVLGETKGHKFTPESANGTEAVTITVNDDVTEPVEAAVAFETLTSTQVDKHGEDNPTDEDNPNPVGEHKDIDDEDQTVTSEGSEKTPKVSTNADFEGGLREVVAGAKVVDQVSYEGLVPGKEYILDAQLISKEDGKTVLGETKGHKFTPESANGTEAVTITVNDDVTEPVEAAVAFETLTSTQVDKHGEDNPTDEDNPNPVGEHKDIDDEDQTVTSEGSEKTPKVSTNADFEGGLREVVAGAKVVDQVSYEGLVPGKEYILDAQLISKEDGKTVLGETKGHKFTPESANGTEAVTITVNDDVTEPVEAAVAFETLTSTQVDKHGEDNPTDEDNPNPVGEHKDIDDEDQTVTSEGSEKTPKVSTNADFEGGLREVVAGAKVVDQVSYEGLVPGKEYILDAQLISKEDGKTVLGETKGHKFTPESANGTEAVTITVNDDVTEPVEAAVAFETLTSTQVDKHGEDNPTDEDNPNPVGEHKDIDDEDQTVTSEGSEKTPKVSTNADFEGGLREVVAGAKVVDQVSYEGLVPGKEYILDAQLISKEDGKTVLGETKGHKFTPESANGTEAVTITVNDDVTEPVEAAVAFETLTSTQVDKHGEDNPTDEDNPNPVGEHKDIDDEDQTVTSEGSEKTPKVSTNADFEGGLREVVAGAKVVDQVSYEGLVPGKEYILDAQLISKEDGKTVLGETKGHKFTPESANGTEAVTITVNDDVTEPVEAAVAFETLTSTQVDKHGEDNPTDEDNPNPVGEHKDIDDEDQTVTSEGSEKTPKVSTNADFEGGLREVVAGAKVVDQVSYEGLVPGKEYILDAQLISKEDGKTVLGETKGHKFTPESANGTEAVTITVNDDVTEPVEAAVAFETLTSTQVDKHGEDNPTDEDNPNPVGEHKDIDDEDQTVTSEGSEKTPKVSTNADFEGGLREVVAGAKVVDQVSYEGLVPGKEYILDAQLISKEDGKTVLGETKGHKFTPESANGTEAVTITVNDDVTEPVEAAVAFEELTSTEVNEKGEDTPDTTPENPNHIAEHKDINDEDQTVTSHEVEGQEPGDGGSSHGSSKDNKWWLILIPGIGLGKIIKDHFDHKDHGNHNGGHGDNTGNHDGGNGHEVQGQDAPKGGNSDNGHEDKGQDAPQGGNSDNGHGRGVEVQGQEPEETGNALPSNADRVEIKSVPSGATELEPGMQDYIK